MRLPKTHPFSERETKSLSIYHYYVIMASFMAFIFFLNESISLMGEVTNGKDLTYVFHIPDSASCRQLKYFKHV